MASSSVTTILSLYLLLLLSGSAVADDSTADGKLFQGINDYRSSLNITALLKNGNAACFADQVALYFKDQHCTNSTGSGTVPGTEQQIPNYPDLLANCHLNLTNTRDGVVMPACVPGLVPSAVLSNFTETQYSEYLNDTKYVGAGIASEKDWIVVVLSSSTASGSYEAYSSATMLYDLTLSYHLFTILLGFMFITLG